MRRTATAVVEIAFSKENGRDMPAIRRLLDQMSEHGVEVKIGTDDGDRLHGKIHYKGETLTFATPEVSQNQYYASRRNDSLIFYYSPLEPKSIAVWGKAIHALAHIAGMVSELAPGREIDSFVTARST